MEVPIGGWQEKRMDNLLNRSQMKEVRDYLNQKNADTKGLRVILRKFEKDLEAKGVLPDYLAYALWNQMERRGLK